MDEIKPKIKAIIFDMDGTIINTERAWQKTTIEVIKTYCTIAEFTEEQKKFLRTLSGVGLAHSVAAIKEFFNLPQPIDEIMAYKTKVAAKNLSTDISFIEGFEQFHKRLQAAAIPTSVATNASPETLQQMSQKMNLRDFFGHNLYCSADVGHKFKPDPAVFLHAAQKLLVKPEDCIVFEDSLAGIQAAKAAGMKCIAIKNEFNQNFLDQAHNAIESYHQADEVLKKI